MALSRLGAASAGGRGRSDGATPYGAARMVEEWQPVRRPCESQAMRRAHAKRQALSWLRDEERAMQDARRPINRPAHSRGQGTLAHGELEAWPFCSGRTRGAAAGKTYAQTDNGVAERCPMSQRRSNEHNVTEAPLQSSHRSLYASLNAKRTIDTG